MRVGVEEEEKCQLINATKTCLKILKSIPSCIVKLEEVTDEFLGSWSFKLTSLELEENVESNVTLEDMSMIFNKCIFITV